MSSQTFQLSSKTLDRLLYLPGILLVTVVMIWVVWMQSKLDGKAKECYEQGLYPHNIYGFNRDVVCMKFPEFAR